jgi:hypothetical protein
VLFHPLVARRWRRNHLLVTARIRHSYHESLQICVAKVESLVKVLKHLTRHSLGIYIKDSPKTYMWDLVIIKNSFEIIGHKDNISHKIDTNPEVL